MGAGKVEIIAYFTSIASDETRAEIEVVEKRRGASEAVQCSSAVAGQARRMTG